jgi:hypothetical protein
MPSELKVGYASAAGEPLSMSRPRITLKVATVVVMICLLAGIATSQRRIRGINAPGDSPEAEFHMARVIYGGGGMFSFFNHWWAIDYPDAELHFMPALRRVTNLSVADDSVHLELTDERIFQYPFLFMQQVGQGQWRPNNLEAARLREYLLRGGFLMVDDFHGEYDWKVFEAAMSRVLPERRLVDIPETDPLMTIFFDLDQSIQIPGQRHLRIGRGGQVVARMAGPPRWRGIYDDDNRLMVVANFNIDMGDAWQHADDAYYPAEMTGLAYRLGINYVIYSMTH